jgi:hypothetical protein
MSVDNRTYALRRGDSLLALILIPLLAAGWTAIFVFGVRWEFPSTGEFIWAIANLVSPLPLLVWGLLHALRTRVTFTSDEVVIQHAFLRHRASRGRIAGFRRVADDEAAAILLYEPDSARPLVKLPASLQTDAGFERWLATLVDLDARDTQRSLDRFLEDGSLPGSDTEKLDALKLANRVARIALWIAIALFATTVFIGDRTAVLLAAAILPWLALVAAVREPNLYVLDQLRSDVRASLSGACFVSSMTLAFSGSGPARWVDVDELTVIVAASALGVAVIVVWFAPSLRDLRRAWWGTLIVVAAYAFGCVTVANRDFDRGPKSVHQTAVETRMDEDNRQPVLRVTPWGARTTSEDFGVPRDVFERVAVGQKMCVELWPGALGVRWYELSDCPAG